MKKNEEYILECTDISDQGFGIGHIKGMTIFVSNLLPQEKAKIKIVKVEKTYAIGKVLELLESAPCRTVPICDKANQCGGCAYQHMSYPYQLKYKQEQLQALFSHLQTVPTVLPVLGMENPFYYRNKAQFPIQVQEDQIRSGFYKARTNEIVDVKDCAIQSKEINEIHNWIRHKIPVFLAANLRHIFIRATDKKSPAQVVLIGKWDPHFEGFSQKLHHSFPEIQSIVFNENHRNDNVILGEKYRVLYCSDFIMEDCLGLAIKLHFKSFFQVNPLQMEVLYSKALEMAKLTKEDDVVELYSGTGTIGLLAARQARQVIGVEIVPEAVENAKENAKLNQIENIKFVCQDASQFVKERKEPTDVVFVDPPRKGMSAQGIEDVVLLHPRKIVYISCNPRTLQRDLKIFEEKGYSCFIIQPVDMFCHTGGVECIGVLEKNGNTTNLE